MLAGRIVFTFSPSNLDSSITLSGAAMSTAIGASGVLSIINEDTSAVFFITGGTFTFTTGARSTTPGMGIESLSAGGTWTINGSVTSGANTASGTLASGTFLNDTYLVNLAGRNTLTSSIDVGSVNPVLMTILGIGGFVDNTDRINLSRPGTFNSTSGAYGNASTPGTTNGTIAFQAIGDVPEPSTFAMFAIPLLGTVCLLTARNRAHRTNTEKRNEV